MSGAGDGARRDFGVVEEEWASSARVGEEVCGRAGKRGCCERGERARAGGTGASAEEERGGGEF